MKKLLMITLIGIVSLSACKTELQIPSNLKCVYYDTIMNVNMTPEGKQEVTFDYIKH